MARITSARLVGRRQLDHDLFEYGIRFYDEDGAEVGLGEGGQDVVIQTTDDLEEGETHLYFTDVRVNDVIDDRTGSDVALKSEVTTAVSGKASTTYVDNAVADLATETYVDDAVDGLATTAGVATDMANKRDKINQAKVTLDADLDFVEKFEVINDGSSTSTWPNRVEYGVTPVGGGTGGASRVVQYLNEYFEWRGNARQNTVLWRAFVREFATDPAHDMPTPIWEIQNDRTNRVALHAMYGQGNFYHAGEGTVDGDLNVGGSVSADNIGVPIYGVYDSGSEPTGVPAGTIILVRP